MITTNIIEEEIGIPGERGRRLNDEFFVIRKEDDENRIHIFYDSIGEIQSIEFDVIFSKRINRRSGTNYLPVSIIKETDATFLAENELDDFSIRLDYKVDDGHLFYKSIGIPELPDRAGNTDKGCLILMPSLLGRSFLPKFDAIDGRPKFFRRS